MFYTGFFKDFGRPLAWTHFSGDSPDGVPFKAIIYLPEKLWVPILMMPFYVGSDIGCV